MGKRRDGTRLTRSLLSLLTPCLVSLRLFPGSLRSPLTTSFRPVTPFGHSVPTEEVRSGEGTREVIKDPAVVSSPTPSPPARRASGSERRKR